MPQFAIGQLAVETKERIVFVASGSDNAAAAAAALLFNHQVLINKNTNKKHSNASFLNVRI